MNKMVDVRGLDHVAANRWHVTVASRAELARCTRWRQAFARERKDARHFELVEETIAGFDYRYFVIADASGKVHAVQPFFIVDQDLLEATNETVRRLAAQLRRAWPRVMCMRILMLGSPAGEGHLDRHDSQHARLLAAAAVDEARRLGIGLVALKEFPARYRACLRCFMQAGYARLPSFPMTRLNIDYEDFEAYMVKALSRRTRRDFRLKFKRAEAGPPISQTIVSDVTPVIDDIFPLYLQVYHRSPHHFEKLSKDYLCRLGRLMPDKVRFFLWRRAGRIVAFTVCMMQGDEFFAEYIGLDYTVALDLHLYHYAVRDMIAWAMANGYKWFCSSGLNYDPKFHLRCVLDPIDLYVRHTSRLANFGLRWLLPWLNPVYRDDTLKRFPNYRELWASPWEVAPASAAPTPAGASAAPSGASPWLSPLRTGKKIGLYGGSHGDQIRAPDRAESPTRPG